MRFATMLCAAMLCAFSTAASAASFPYSTGNGDQPVTPGDPPITNPVYGDPTSDIPPGMPTSITLDIVFTLSGYANAHCPGDSSCGDPTTDGATLVGTLMTSDFGDLVITSAPATDGNNFFEASGTKHVILTPDMYDKYTQSFDFTETIGAAFTPPTGGYDLEPFPATANVAYNFTYFYADSAVPEPASWAMMLTGFGLAGSAMRRSRKTKDPQPTR